MRRGRAAGEHTDARDLTDPQATTRETQRPRWRLDGSPRSGPPSPPIRGEDLVGAARRRVQVVRRDDRRRLVDVQPDSGASARGGESALSAARVARHVGGHVDRDGADPRRKPNGFVHRVAVTEDQVAAEPSEGPPEIGEAVAEEPHPVRCREPATEDRRVEHEQWHHRIPSPGRRGQRRVVVHAEIPREQHDRHGSIRSCQAASCAAACHDVLSERDCGLTRVSSCGTPDMDARVPQAPDSSPAWLSMANESPHLGLGSSLRLNSSRVLATGNPAARSRARAFDARSSAAPSRREWDKAAQVSGSAWQCEQHER